MIDYKSVLGIAAAILGFVQYIPYIKDVLARKTRPHAFSWFVWGLPAGIVFIAQFLNGGGAGSWTTGITTILCTAIFILSLFRGEKEIALLDWISLILALLAIVLWIITKDALESVLLVTAADLLGMVPTIRKSVSRPYEETLSTYFTGGLKWLVSLPALTVISSITVIYPVAMLIANWLFVALLLMRRAAIGKADCQ
jgi:hypothetical protein